MVEASKLGMGDEIKALPLPEPPGHMFLGVANVSNQRDRIIRDYNLVHKIFKVTYEQLLTEELTTQK
ncbi:hypothetical protein [Motilimonas eburnea]|uniref:hypothetical protein n=1 Tax=Motilimonas eburnea TaxID=1737488 RepID=UPI001E593BA1|nr:hypothetical protein [Motilimonas eburnea]MCE2573772.1 hypothetical protein [Motilimonas eburnea]